MPSFQVRAIGADGVPFQGEMDAPSRASLAGRLQAQGAVPLRIVPVQAGTLRRLLSQDVFARKNLSPSGRAELLQRLSTLLGSGISVEEGLAILGRQSEAPAETRIVLDLLRRLRAGATLADAMGHHVQSFPPVVAAMVRAGEASGALPATLASLSGYLRRSEDVRQSIRSALIYPVILLLTASASMFTILTVVLPTLKPAIEESGGSVPLPTRLAFAASDLVIDYGWALALAAVAAGFAAHRALSDPTTRLRRDRHLLRLPVIGAAVLRAETARLARTLGVLLSGGVALPVALALAQPVVSNSVIADVLAKVTLRVREGGGLADPLAASRLFPDIANQLVRIGEATGRLDKMLQQLADIFDAQVQRTISRSIAILVPVLTIGLGAMVAGIIASVMLAVLNVNDLAR